MQCALALGIGRRDASISAGQRPQKVYMVRCPLCFASAEVNGNGKPFKPRGEKMNKDEAIKHAKKSIPILRRLAVKYARENGKPPWATHSTAVLLRLLKIETTWETRAKVKGALTRALNEAADLGLVQKVTRGVTGWVYIGPEVEAAAASYRTKESARVKEVKGHLRTLGLPESAAVNYRTDDSVTISTRALKTAATRVRGRLGLKR